MSSCRKHLYIKHVWGIITCSCMIAGASMEEKQDVLRYSFLWEQKKCRGYLLWFVKDPKPFKHTTSEKESEQIISKPNTASDAITKKGNKASVFFIALEESLHSPTTSHFVVISCTNRHHRDAKGLQAWLVFMAQQLLDSYRPKVSCMKRGSCQKVTNQQNMFLKCPLGHRTRHKTYLSNKYTIYFQNSKNQKFYCQVKIFTIRGMCLGTLVLTVNVKIWRACLRSTERISQAKTTNYYVTFGTLVLSRVNLSHKCPE